MTSLFTQSSCTQVRAVRIHGGRQLAALATSSSGLVLVSAASDNIVASFPTGSPVWSCAWSERDEHQVCGILHGANIK